MSELQCACAQHPSGHFYGDDPSGYPELQVLHDNGQFPAHVLLQCQHCGCRWQVDQIPYGGLYGDFEWQRVEAE